MVRRSAAPTAKAIAFFRKHCGRVVSRRVGESTADARTRMSKALARAEAEASARGWRCDWEGDPDGPEEALGVALRDDRGHVINSTWGVADPDRNTKRVIEAKLANEALEGR